MKILEYKASEDGTYDEILLDTVKTPVRVQYTPPSEEIMDEVQKFMHLFQYSFEKGDVMAWRGVIYTKNQLDNALLMHELVHIEQQSRYPDIKSFYRNYVDVPAFRLSIELEAYKRQYLEAKEMFRGPVLEKYLWGMASDLGGRYQLNINKLQAYQLIKK